MKVQTRFETNLNGAISDTDTTITLNAVPVNTVGYLTLGRGTATEEDIKYLNIAGLQILSCLRGLSKTALTDTEVLANKYPQSDDETVESTILHYILNNKPDLDGDESITGTWTFEANKILQSAYAAPTVDEAFTPKKYVVDTFIQQSVLDTDVTLAADSDAKLATQKAVRAFVLSQVGGVAIVVDHSIYTPAFLTGGASPSTNYLLWGALTDGSFRVTIDGSVVDVTGINTVGTTSMNEVATIIQAAVRLATGLTETVTWTASKLLLTSSNTTVSSSITELSNAGVGTDISGVTAGDPNLDGDTGHGVVTAAVLDPSADSGSIAGLDTNGNIKRTLLQDYDSKGQLLVGDGSESSSMLTVGSNGLSLVADSAETTGLKYYDVGKYKAGVGEYGAKTWWNFSKPFTNNSTILDNKVWTVVNGTPEGRGNFVECTWSADSPYSVITNISLMMNYTFAKDCVCEFSLNMGAFDGELGGWGLVNTVAPFSNVTDTSAAACFVLNAAGQLYAHTGTGAAYTNTAINDPTLTLVHTYRIEFTSGSNAKFYINGVLKATHTTNLPSGSAINWGFGGGGKTSSCTVSTVSEPYFAVEK